MRKVIPFMALMEEISLIFDIHIPNPEVFCKWFKDNKSCIAVANSNRFSPRTKHIAIKYHHLRVFVQKKNIQICYIDTREQTEDIFAYPLNEHLLVYPRRKLSIWWLFKSENFASKKGSLRIKELFQHQMRKMT